MTSKPFVTPPKFADLTGLPDELIRDYVKTGKLPYLNSGRSAKIHVASGLECLRRIAEETALSCVLTPEYVKKMPEERSKRGGRPPDSIRLARRAN